MIITIILCVIFIAILIAWLIGSVMILSALNAIEKGIGMNDENVIEEKIKEYADEKHISVTEMKERIKALLREE